MRLINRRVESGKERDAPALPWRGIRHRGRTQGIGVKWAWVNDQERIKKLHIPEPTPGVRIIEGIAYNAALKGPRENLDHFFCPDHVWHSEDENVFYRHPSIRWTVDELRRMNLVGVPLHVSHDTEELPPVGKVLSSYIDDKTGNLHIIGEIRGNDVVGQTMIDMLDKARLMELIQFNTSLGDHSSLIETCDMCSELSVGYGLERNEETTEVFHNDIDEISLVPEAHFRGCKVRLSASRGPTHKKGKGITTTFRTIRAGSTKKTTTSLGTRKTANLMSGKPNPATKKAQDPQEGQTDGHSKLQQELDTLVSHPGVNKDLLGPVQRMKMKLAMQEQEKKELANKLRTYEEREKEREKRKQERKREFKEQTKDHAEAVIESLRQVYREQTGGGDIGKKARVVLEGLLTDNDPVSQEISAVQAACGRGIRTQKKEIKDLRKENKELKQRLQELESGIDMEEDAAAVAEEMDLDGDLEEGFEGGIDHDAGANHQAQRVGAGRGFHGRNKQQAGGSEATFVPEWASDILGQNFGRAALDRLNELNNKPQQERPVMEQRTLKAGRTRKNAATRSSSSAVTRRRANHGRTGSVGYQPAGEFDNSFYNKPVDHPTPLRPGMPVNAKSMRNSPHHRKMWDFLNGVKDTADFTTGSLYSLAGRELGVVDQ